MSDMLVKLRHKNVPLEDGVMGTLHFNSNIEYEEVSKSIRKYILDNFLFGDSGNLENDRSLIESGVVDSTGVLEIVSFLESAFDIDVQDQDLVPENFDTIAAMSRYVARKRPASTNTSPL